jgi:hypothetical protein
MSSVCASGSLVRGDVVCCFSHLSISQRLYLRKRQIARRWKGHDIRVAIRSHDGIVHQSALEGQVAEFIWALVKA